MAEGLQEPSSRVRFPPSPQNQGFPACRWREDDCPPNLCPASDSQETVGAARARKHFCHILSAKAGCRTLIAARGAVVASRGLVHRTEPPVLTCVTASARISVC